MERLRWEDVLPDAKVISISSHPAREQRTHWPVELALPLRRAPPRATGFTHWQPDVLRHTFATHHLATFRSYAELQLEMGHRSAELLRTRYVAMEGIYRRGESILVG